MKKKKNNPHFISLTFAWISCCYSASLEPAEGLVLLMAEYPLGLFF